MSSTSRDLEAELERLRDERERYREATERTLDLLDEVIGYLDRNRRSDIAQMLRRNRRTIIRNLRD